MTGQGALVVFFDRGQGQQQPWQVMATIDQADIRGSEPHNHDPSGAASDYEDSPSCLLRLRLTLSVALGSVLQNKLSLTHDLRSGPVTP